MDAVFGIPILFAIICGLLLIGGMGVGTFLLLVQLGVIARKAVEPQRIDTNVDYTLSQGREVSRTHDEKES